MSFYEKGSKGRKPVIDQARGSWVEEGSQYNQNKKSGQGQQRSNTGKYPRRTTTEFSRVVTVQTRGRGETPEGSRRFGPGAAAANEQSNNRANAHGGNVKRDSSSDRRQGGYRPREEGSDNRRQGNFRPREEGSDNRRQGNFRPREEGFDNRRQGNFRSREEGSDNRRQAPFRKEENQRPSYKDFQQQKPQRAVENNQPEQSGEEELTSIVLAGRNPIREALKSGRDLEKLLVQKGELSGSAKEIVMMAKEAKIPVQMVEKVRLDAMAHNHQGMAAVVSAFTYATVEDILQVAKQREEDPFIVILDSITDPHNLGAIIRSAECAGAHGVIVPQRRAVGLTPAAVKASAGAIEYLKVARVTNLTRTIEELQKLGIWAYASDAAGEDYCKVDFQGPCALVVGAEGEGISKLVLSKCDQVVSLPMKGKIDSLNASVAAGILLYQMAQARD